LLASGQVELGDMLRIDWDDDARCLVFQNHGPAPPSVVPVQPVTTFAAPTIGRAHGAVAGATAP
jgi:hypothetical protein